MRSDDQVRTKGFTAGRSLTAVALGALLVAGPACDQASQVVQQAEDVVGDAGELVDTARICTSLVQLADAARQGNLDEAAAQAEQIGDLAPEGVRADAATIRRAVRRARGQTNPELLARPEVRRAVQDVQQYARQTCNPSG